MTTTGATAALPPKSLEFFVNYACNAKCPFCFNPPDATPELDRGLPLKSLAERMAAGWARGYRALKFIGGEVTVRDDLPKILSLAKKIGYRQVQVTTNALRLADPAYARLLVSKGATQFRFSVHGHTPELHDALVAVPGALAKVERAAENLRELGIPFGVNYVLNRLNFTALPDTLPWLHETLGAEEVIVYFLRYQGFATLPANKALLRLSMTEAAPSVEKAVRVLKARGLPVPALIHFPPCVLPGLREHLLDWNTDPEAAGQGNTPHDLVTLPDGSGGRIHDVTNSGKRHVAACRTCRLKADCLGVEANYVAEHGEAEFAPL